MEFFRKHRKVIISIIGLAFIAWTFGMMAFSVLAFK
jgi:hypothetical protein